MVKKKTRKDKIKTAQRRDVTKLAFDSSILDVGMVTTSKKNRTPNKAAAGSELMMAYPPQLIAYDIRKTLILSAFMFLVEAGFFVYLR